MLVEEIGCLRYKSAVRNGVKQAQEKRKRNGNERTRHMRLTAEIRVERGFEETEKSERKR